MTHLAVLIAAAETHVDLPMPIWAFGAIALAVFAVLGFVIWSYRDVANRHSHKAGPGAADHAAAPGATHHGSGHPSQGHCPRRSYGADGEAPPALGCDGWHVRPDSPRSPR